MPDLTVRYQRPNHALATLVAEVRARYGAPARVDYVAGTGPTTWNVTGHNADARGVCHAADLFVGSPGNLSTAQGAELSELLRAEGPRGYIDGHPDRLFYIIYNGRMAGDFTGWDWVAYGGSSPHTDHIHISTCDTYWGDPAPVSPLDYDSAAPWGIALAPAGTITALQEDEDMANVPQDEWDGLRKLVASLVDNVATKADLQTLRDELPAEVWGYRNPALEPERDAYAVLRSEAGQ
jgi:hypothetical protein